MMIEDNFAKTERAKRDLDYAKELYASLGWYSGSAVYIAQWWGHKLLKGEIDGNNG